MILKIIKSKQFWITLMIPIFVAAVFWTQSRLPALDGKAQMGERVNISAIAFDVVLPLSSEQSSFERIFRSSVNWGYTNWKGMTFGILFGAAILAFIQLLPRVSGTQNRFLNSTYGLMMGSPLSVCVNCATPIAQGLMRSGMKTEFALAILLSSPVLNPIVISIAFAMLPFHLAMIKVVLSIVFILIMIPVLTRIFSANKYSDGEDKVKKSLISGAQKLSERSRCEIQVLEMTWWHAAKLSHLSFVKNLILIIKITLPLMIFAGFLGALLIEVLPENALSNLDEGVSIIKYLAVSVVGSFLPVPISFDVIAVNTLLSSGMPVGLAAILLFTLGIFSVFPAMVISRTISIRLGLGMFISVVIFGVISGFVTDYVDKELIRKAGDDISIGMYKDFRSDVSHLFEYCSGLNSEPEVAVCVERVLDSSIFSGLDVDACEGLYSGDRLLKEKVERVCRDKTYISTTSRNAVAERNVDICNALSTPERIGECLIGFVKEYQFNNDNPELCNSIQSITARAICMNAVINSRISMRNKEACDVSYFSRKEKVLCFDKMNAAIASDYKSIDVCNMLSTQGSRELCITDVSGMYIYLHHNYDICDSIQNDRLKGQCSRNSIYAKAQEQGDVKLCNSLDVTEVSFCELSVLLKGFEKSRSRHINSIASPDVQNEQGGVFYHSEKHHPRKNINWTHEGGSNNLEIWSVPHVSSVNTKESKFHKVAGEGVGFENVWSMSLSDFVDPFVYGKGIATGDYNNDGWPDVLVATEKGVNLYTNIDGGRFSYTLSLNPPEYIANTFVVTFVDINNDGWLDIYFSSYSKGNYIALSNKGKFLSDNIHRLESKKSIVSLASGFYDLDLDGDLDMVVGNWSFGQDKGFVPKLSDNIWYYNDNNTFKAYYPEEEKGETLSVLLSDMNNDSLAEMFIANDRGAPDVIYLSNKEGVGTRVHSMSNRMPVTSFNTMSYESADFNNDLNFDVFSTDMTIGKGKDIHYCEVLDDNIRGECFELLSVQKEIKSLNVSWCNGLSDDEKDECYSAMIMQLIKRDADAALCEKIPLSYSGKREFCYNMLEDIKNEKSNFSNASIRQVESNKMLFGDGKGNFSDVTNVMGVGNSFWSWNAKAADLDNDEWQDIYVANGFGFSEFRSISSNVLFRNITGNKFVRSESEFGLENYSNTPSYTYFDYDRDGDIDILSTSIMSGLSLFVNNSVNTNSIVFDLRDFVANRFCVGCKLIIKYNQGKSSQIREIKLSGGFMSYDEPIAHFGLGEYEHIDGVSVVWSDGERIDIDQKFMSGYRYKLIRNK